MKQIYKKINPCSLAAFKPPVPPAHWTEMADPAVFLETQLCCLCATRQRHRQALSAKGHTKLSTEIPVLHTIALPGLDWLILWPCRVWGLGVCQPRLTQIRGWPQRHLSDTVTALLPFEEINSNGSSGLRGKGSYENLYQVPFNLQTTMARQGKAYKVSRERSHGEFLNVRVSHEALQHLHTFPSFILLWIIDYNSLWLSNKTSTKCYGTAFLMDLFEEKSLKEESK